MRFDMHIMNMRYLMVVVTGAFILMSASMGVGQTKELSGTDRYVRLAQVNPLYAWPGVDLEKMDTAIDALDASRAEILSFADQYNGKQKERIETALYPTAFLREMRVLEAQRRALSSASDHDDLVAYEEQLHRTIEAQQSYMELLIAALRDTASEVSYKGLEYHFGRSSFEHFISGIEAYHIASVKAQGRAELRWECTTVDTQRCEHPEWAITDAPESIDVDPKYFKTPSANITRAIREHGPLGGAPVANGWAVLNRSDCYPDATAVPFLMWRFPTASGVEIFRPEVLSDVFVHDHRIGHDSNAYERILETLGMEGYLFQPHTNLYACPDAAGDSTRLRAMAVVAAFADQYTKEFLQEEDVFANLIAGLSDVKNASILNEALVQQVMHEVATLLYQQDKGELYDARVSQNLAELENLALTYRLGTFGLSQDLMNLVYGNTAIGDYVPYASWGFLEELLFTRNAPELLLGGTNPSIYDGNYSQVEHFRGEVSPRLKSYTRDLAGQYDEEEMTRILIKGLIAEYRLARFQSRAFLFGE